MVSIWSGMICSEGYGDGIWDMVLKDMVTSWWVFGCGEVGFGCWLGWQMCPIVWTGTDGRELTAVWKGRLCIWRRGSQDSGRNRETFSKFGDEDVLFCHLSTIGCGSANISYFIESLNSKITFLCFLESFRSLTGTSIAKVTKVTKVWTCLAQC